MSGALKLALLIVALLGAPVGYIFYNADLSPNDWRYEGNLRWTNAGIHPVPVPIAGAGLPFLLVAGGVYWVVRRSRKAKQVGE
jgi:hypothetical protein